MKPLYQLLNVRAYLSGAVALLSLASCGSYQYAGYDSDGIYADSAVAERYTKEEQTPSADKTLYYKQAFAQQAEVFENMTEGGAIFTDIDSYSSGTYDAEAQQDQYYGEAYGPWGDQVDEIAIHIYPNPHYGYYGYGYLHPYYYGYGYGHPFSSRYYSYYDPYWSWPYYGYGSRIHSPWHWNAAWIGLGFSDYWYYNRYLSGYYGYSYNTRQNAAYINSRRNAFTDNVGRNSRSAVRYSDSYRNTRNVRATSRSNQDYNSVRTTRSSNSRTYNTRASRVENPSRVRSNRSSSDARSYRTSTPQAKPSTTRRSTPSYTPSRTTRSSSGTYRSSGSVRSSGTTSGGARSSRGRGN